MRLGNLNRHLHRIFDLAPSPVLALRVNAGATALAWSIEGDTLTLTPDGGTPTTFTLTEHTIGSLATACVAAGFTVPTTNSDVADLSAVCLLAGTGNSGNSNGDHLLATQNLTLLLLDALGVQVETAGEDLLDALEQMWPLQSDEEWADYWGQHFGVWRRDDETDAVYTQRIFTEIVRPRSNRFALESWLSEELGTKISIFEPWTRVLHASGYAPWQDICRLRDGRYWTHGTIEVSGASRDAMAPLVERIRAAGVWPRYREDFPTSLTSQAQIDGVLSNVVTFRGLASNAELWIDRNTPQGGVVTGNEPWQWEEKSEVRSHVTYNAQSGIPHGHIVTSIDAGDCRPNWSVFTQIYIDPASVPTSIYLGWQLAGSWKYARWGTDGLKTFVPHSGLGGGGGASSYNMGSIPNTGRWMTLMVPASALGITSTSKIVSGLCFALLGGRAWFGRSGIVVPQTAVSFHEMHYLFDSGTGTYQVDGQNVTNLYTLDGDYVNVTGFVSEYGENLYLLESPAGGETTHGLMAGEGWRVGDLINKNYMAGTADADLTQATWTVGSGGVTTSLTYRWKEQPPPLPP